jgi:putative colanic acid biosynthesis acetyltransferase WcaF
MIKHKLDIKRCRESRPYSKREYFLRFLWTLASPLFFLSPRVFFKWRRMLLIVFGAKVGKNVHIYPSAKIYLPWNLIIGDNSCIGEWVLIYNLGVVELGVDTTISHRAHICAGTHDYENPSLPLIRSSITIGDSVWICSDVFVGPGVEIADEVVVGAASVVTKHLKEGCVYVGNPARVIKRRLIS